MQTGLRTGSFAVHSITSVIPRPPLQAARVLGGAPPPAQHVQPWTAVPTSVVSGVLSGVIVAVILAAARLAWHRSRVPSALSRRVRRGRYLAAVRAASRHPKTRKVDVFAPRLQPAGDSEIIAGLQADWEKVNQRDGVRVLTLDSDDSLQGGAELLDRGMAVRVLPHARDLGSDSQTFHLFETSVPEKPVAIINSHQGDADHPMRISGVAATEPYRRQFAAEWDKARPLESVITERIRPRTAMCQGPAAVLASVKSAEEKGLRLGTRCRENVLPHLAFRDASSVVFILGLPGSGKSYIRSRLADRLISMGVECASLTDYPDAYGDMVRTLLKLSPGGNGFKAYGGGAFTVLSEKTLSPALIALRGKVLSALQEKEVVLVEFARADLMGALHLFNEVKTRSQIIYVRAPASRRKGRIAGRVVQPEVRVEGQVVTINLSDDHLLPESVQQDLYATDRLDLIKGSAEWKDRIFEIDNESNSRASADAKVDEFITSITSPYKTVFGSAFTSGS